MLLSSRSVTSSPRLALLALCLLGAAACHKKVHEPRLLVLRKVDDHTRLFEASPDRDGPAHELLPDLDGDLITPRAIEGGRALLVLHRAPNAERSELIHAKVGVTIEQDLVLAHDVPGRIVAAADDGSAVLLADADAVSILRLGARAATPEHVTDFRYFAGGDLSNDGARAVVSGIPRTCTSDPMGACPIELWAVDLGASPPALRALVSGARASYAPTFVPGSKGAEIGYQTTAGDDTPACVDHVNDCRHDLMKIAWDGGAPELLRRGPAIGPYFAPDGKRWALLSFDRAETSCRSVICDTMSLYVASAAGEKLLVTANASTVGRHAFSPDGRWIVYVGRDRKTIEVVRSDGSLRRTIGEGLDRVWVR